MKQYLTVTLPNGAEYEIQVANLAAARYAQLLQDKLDAAGVKDEEAAAPIAQRESVSIQKQVEEEFSIEDNIKSFMVSQCQWDGLATSARLLRFVTPRIEMTEVMISEFRDAPAKAAPVENARAGDIPVDMFLSILSEKGGLCLINMLNSDSGQPLGAIIVVRGLPAQINAFVAICNQLEAKMLEKRPSNEAKRKAFLNAH
jgi:hypothetical protein